MGNLTIFLDKAELQKVEAWLSKMSEVDRDNAVQKALRQGMRVIQQEGKSNLRQRNHVVTGNLRRSFSLRVNKKKAYALSGFKRSKNGGNHAHKNGGNHAHLVDRGTKARYTKKGAYRGSISKDSPNTGSRFWTEAVESKGASAVNNVINAVYNYLSKITQRSNN